jgi:hypothetical protein
MLTASRNISNSRTATSPKSQSVLAQELSAKAFSSIQSARLNRPSASRSLTKVSSSVGYSTRSAERVIPGGRVFTYRISASGTTYFGNTNFPSANTTYTPAFNFRLPGALYIEPKLPAQNINRRNGSNAREITFVIGNDISLITAGTLRYSTHTWGHRHWGNITVGRPALDTAFVRANRRTSRLSSVIDPQWSRNDASNLFSWRSSFISAPKQILAGNVTIRFTNGGRRVTGRVNFFGNGFIEPGAYAYAATFTGNLFR